MSIVIRVVNLIESVGFRRTSTFIKALHRDGTYSQNGRAYKYGNTSRGLTNFLLDPNTRYEVLSAVRNVSNYRKIDSLHPYSQRGGTPQTKRLGELISSGLLSNQRIKLFDGACNHGYLAEHVQNLERYIGMDLVKETIETACNEAKERFERTRCKDYKFIQGDVLDPTSYQAVPKDNNVVVCTGVLGHFRPRYIKILLDNLNQVLSDNYGARIYLGVPVFMREPNSHLLRRAIYSDDGVDFVKCGEGILGLNLPIEKQVEKANLETRLKFQPTFGISYRSFDPYQMINFIKGLGYEIDLENSDLEQLHSSDYEHKRFRGIHFCIKKKQLA